MEALKKYLNPFFGLLITVLTIVPQPAAYAMLSDSSKVIFTAYLEDNIPLSVELVLDTNQLPEYYFSKIKTPVCEDSLCYLVKIDIYWDALGNFLDYETDSDTALTKFDHIKFTKEDHQKLKKILSNGESVLRDYAVETLLDPVAKKNSDVVADAVAGATNTSIKDEVVEGALYSTYTLWHIVNGSIAQKIKAHSQTMFNKKLLDKMLSSNREQYQYYALNKIPSSKLAGYTHEFIGLIKSGIGNVPYFAIEKIQETAWADPIYQLKLITLIREVNFQMQNEILNHLQNKKLSKEAVQKLEAVGGILKENQKQKIDKIIAIQHENFAQ